MNLKTIFSGAVLAAVLVGGTMDAEALRIARGIHLDGDHIPLKADGSRVLDPGSDEEALFLELMSKGLNVLEEPDLIPPGVADLKKYLGRLIENNITADRVQAAKSTAIRSAIHNKIIQAGIASRYHTEASIKAGHVREAVNAATACLVGITRAVGGVALAGGNVTAVRVAFEGALEALNRSLTNEGGGGLAQMIADNFDGGAGKSGIALEEQRNAIIGLRAALTALLAMAVERINTLKGNTAKMQLFHEVYRVLCAHNLGGDRFFNDFNEYDLPDDENGNVDFHTRYIRWAEANHVAIPNDGDTIEI
ncbi:MAG: hypothetical protein LBJ96_03695 [Holosporaceae bacterium]|jgi:hypothetical protein|nr:hypothetical protein [Holosporaceae bacterium]